MNPDFNLQVQDALNRRVFLRNTTSFLGLSALAGLTQAKTSSSGLPGFPTHAAKAKRIIYLFQSGAPSQMDLFDPKPAITDRRGEDLPDSIRKGQRLTTMTSGQKKFPVAPTILSSGGTARVAWSSANCCRTCPSRPTSWRRFAVVTEAINHDPAITCQIGHQLAGRPSICRGSVMGWVAKTAICRRMLCSLLVPAGRTISSYDRLWSSGFLPTRHQGVVRNTGDAVCIFQPAGSVHRYPSAHWIA